MHPTYYVARGTYVHFGRDYAVLMDATEGHYFALDNIGQRLVSASIAGWPNAVDVLLDEKEEQERAELLSGMVRKRLLTAEPKKGKPATPESIEGVESVLGAEMAGKRRAGMGAALAFRTAQIRSDRSLKRRPLGQTIVMLRSRKRSPSASPPNAVSEIAERLAPHVRGDALSRLEDGQSLLRSVTFIEYLSSFGLYPQLIFAFRFFPFESYCWIQYEKTVFFEDLSIVRSFHPLLAV